MTRRLQADDAVSPVIGVMLMLVVTLIIAAVVSAFAAGLADSQNEIPQASITATFSVSDGMEIYHSGGDALSLSKVQFVLRHSDMFGADMASRSASIINKTLMNGQPDGKGTPVMNMRGEYGILALTPGNALYITEANCNATLLQPEVAPASWDPSDRRYKSFYPLCFQNPNNIGKTFYLEATDLKGNLISRSEVVIKP